MRRLAALGVLAVAVGGAGRGWAADPAIDFARQIRPILTNSCFRCHGPDEQTVQAGLRLDSFAAATAKRDGGEPAIVPGKPEASSLLARVSAADDERMPPADSGPRLKPAEIERLEQWIQQGATYRGHWAFERPQRPEPPKSRSDPAWCRNGLDAFVLARLDRESLKPAPEADRATLIRRLSLDLTGLPPTIEEVDRFAADASPAAYEQLVDRLLQSPAYGERWAKVWLDLARYADSAGYAQDPPRTIWRYRDWLIRALNDNLPFDQFTMQQLAGDLLPNPTEDQLLATAFHRNTMTNSEGGTDDEEFRNAAVIDRVVTTMEAWMGLTMACAQCHNHKYDPITQEEFFRVFAIFNNTEDADQPDERPNLVAFTPEQEQEKAKLQQQIADLDKTLAEQEQTLQRQAAAKPGSETQAAGKGPLAARFVRVELPGRGVFLSLAEVEIFAAGQNVARGGKATQISTDFAGPPELAVDGNTNGHYADAKSTTHTAQADDPWWEVDLGKTQAVERILVWNRTDGGASERLKNFRVVVLDEKRQPRWVQNVAAAPHPSVALAVPKTAEELTDQQRTALAEYRRAGASPERAASRQRLESLHKQLAGIQGIPTPILRELPPDKRRKTHIQMRGNFMVKGKEVTPGVPAAFHPLPDGGEPNRLAFARWLVDERNPLTARVVANRFWEHLFGTGLVVTSEDFGIQGEPPSHQDVLDFLATELLRLRWDTKQFVKLIVTSATYRQSSRVAPDLAARDPENRLLAHGPRFRLPAETLRDQALFASGLLSRKIGGPSVHPPRPKLGLASAFGGSTDWSPSPGEDRYRRGLYTEWRRTTPYPAMTTFDAPSREFCTIRRIRTNTPLQALVTLNDPVFVEAAQALARRVIAEGGATPTDRARYAFRLCLARAPRENELARLVALHAQATAKYRAAPDAAQPMATDPLGPLPAGMDAADAAAWTVVGNVLMNLDEFVSRP